MRELIVHASQPDAERACRLTADDRNRRQDDLDSLFAAVADTQPLPDGQVLTLRGNPNEIWPRVEAFVAEERVCCPFFSFRAVERADGVELTITGGRLTEVARTNSA
jgi:hypothetical protein